MTRIENPMVAWAARYPEGRIERLDRDDPQHEDMMAAADLYDKASERGDYAADEEED